MGLFICLIHIPEKNSFSWGQPKYGKEKADALDEIISFTVVKILRL